eukprot:TRINITY_DN6290_c0_g2_i1.p1 TRINITY_DN6290_c0_g2~~TRINITY_DN6290_c0_g2_i1.p1  ORF type:complete len:434 (-),score=41.31 TRINITY_DN6290_c0_g2_i1:3-1304(-)
MLYNPNYFVLVLNFVCTVTVAINLVASGLHCELSNLLNGGLWACLIVITGSIVRWVLFINMNNPHHSQITKSAFSSYDIISGVLLGFDHQTSRSWLKKNEGFWKYFLSNPASPWTTFSCVFVNGVFFALLSNINSVTWIFLPQALFWLSLDYVYKQNLSHQPIDECTSDKIYTGLVTHTRMEPFVHSFTYPIYFLYTKLSPDNRSFDEMSFFTMKSPKDKKYTVARLELDQYLSIEQIRTMVESEYKNAGKIKSNDDFDIYVYEVFLMTHWRYLGYKFNPISYYFCYNKNKDLVSIVDEVSNTPWGDKCHYVGTTERNENGRYLSSFRKKMHVSPFMEMDYTYNSKISQPKDTLIVDWSLEKENKNRFYVHMKLEALELNQNNLLYMLVSNPLITFKVVFLIYYQALVLKLRGAVHYHHPKYNQENKTNINVK